MSQSRHPASGILHSAVSRRAGAAAAAAASSSRNQQAAEPRDQAMSSQSEADLPEVVEESCHARVGLMGNPSDGFGGKTLSFLVENFAAGVRIEAQPGGGGVEICEPVVFDSLDQLAHHCTKIGYTGGLRLLQATCKVFATRCAELGLPYRNRGFRMTYSTDIPRMVGLSGSSAIIVACLRALLRFNRLAESDLCSREELPQLVLDIEKRELGISAGLQDRVIQTYGGLVHMDFASPAVTSVTNASATPSRSPYTPLDPALLPPFYLAYDTEAGGDSGAVHSTVRARWESREPALVEGMAALGGLADQAVECLNSGDYGTLALLMERNFATRLELYGAQVVGAKNLQAVRLGGEMGLACKFTGSGGALLCMRREGGWLGAAEEQGAVEAFKQMGFAFVRVRIPPPPL